MVTLYAHRSQALAHTSGEIILIFVKIMLDKKTMIRHSKQIKDKTEQHMDNSAHLTHRIQEQLGHKFYRVNNDSNGNPRYVIHFLAFANDYDEARKIANRLGFRVYKARHFGGGFVCQSYNIERDAERILEARLMELAA